MNFGLTIQPFGSMGRLVSWYEISCVVGSEKKIRETFAWVKSLMKHLTRQSPEILC